MRDDILERMTAWVGDVTKPGREIDRAAIEIANSRIKNVLYDGPPTGRRHGQAQSYPGMVRYGSNEHLKQIKETTAALKASSAEALKSIAQQRGYFGCHPPKNERFEYSKNWQPKVMESYTAAGEHVVIPVHGDGQAGLYSGSRFDGVPTGTPSLERKRMSDVKTETPDAPRLPNGNVDMGAVCRLQNEQFGHVPQTGRSNMTVGGIGPRLRSQTSKDIDKYPTPADFDE